MPAIKKVFEEVQIQFNNRNNRKSDPWGKTSKFFFFFFTFQKNFLKFFLLMARKLWLILRKIDSLEREIWKWVTKFNEEENSRRLFRERSIQRSDFFFFQCGIQKKKKIILLSSKTTWQGKYLLTDFPCFPQRPLRVRTNMMGRKRRKRKSSKKGRGGGGGYFYNLENDIPRHLDNWK